MVLESVPVETALFIPEGTGGKVHQGPQVQSILARQTC